MEDTPFSMNDALKILRQAWRRDKTNDTVGAFASDGGLVSAVYCGVSGLQQNAGLDSDETDNATTLIMSLVADDDDVDLLDVFLDWEPHFRMAAEGTKGTIDSTFHFLMENGAPNAANRYLGRRNDVVMAKRVQFMMIHAYHRIETKACALKAKFDNEVLDRNEFYILSLVFEMLVLDKGQVYTPTISANGKVSSVYTQGLALLGKHELVVLVGDKPKHVAKRKLQKMIEASLCNDPIDAVEELCGLPVNHPMMQWLTGVSKLTGLPQASALRLK